MQGLIEFVKTLGAARIAAMVAVTVALIGFFAFVMMRVTAPQMTPLFTDLSFEDSSAIVKDLERQGIPYELRNDGAIVMVPKDRVARLRMKLAEGGLPKGGGVGYEIFDKSDALGTTSFVQNINHLRALEGELARTIRSHRPRPGRARASGHAGAAAVLARQGRALGLDRAQGARHARAAAGARHPPPRRLRRQRPEARSACRSSTKPAACSPTAPSDDPNGSRCERRRAPQPRSSSGCASRSSRSSPRSSAPAAPACRSPPISTSTASPQTSDKYDPEGRVVRSSQTREESAASSDGNGKPGHGRQRNSRRANAAAKPRRRADAARRATRARRSEEIVNYEISSTTKTEVIEGGRVNRISVAVLVDGNYSKNDKGEITYQPRSKEEIDRIAALVRTAIGFDQKRGDQVEVVNLRFAETPATSDRRADRLAVVRSSSPRTTSCARSRWS